MDKKTIAAALAAAALAAGVGAAIVKEGAPKDEAEVAERAAVVEALESAGIDTKVAPEAKAMPVPDRRKPSADDAAYKTASKTNEACACASGPACAQWRLAPGGVREVVRAPFGVTLGPGSWRGSDCLPKPCVNHGADDTWPKACPGSP